MKTSVIKKIVCRLIVVFMFLGVSPSYAEDAKGNVWKDDTVNLNLGTFLTNRDTKVRIDSSTGQGTQFSAEDDLGLSKNKSVFRADMYVRFAQNHRLDFSYYDLSRDATSVIDRTIQYGDETFLINSTVKSNFNLNIIKAAYTYLFVRDEKKELGLSAGLFIQDYDIQLQQIGGANAQAKAEMLAPLPVLGLRGTWRFSDEWWLRASAEIFSLSYDNYSGHLTDVMLAVEYNMFKNIGFGLGYNDTSFKLIADADTFIGEANIDYGGVIVYTKMHF
ncbi:MAG: hypothetical protein KAJ39_02765 [Gammaproteobacteria bacterium]|nr:hypothetical protein [Gammaproteobacteria bacterium]